MCFSRSTSPKIIGQLVASPLLQRQRSDSVSSNASSLIDDIGRTLKMPTTGTTNLKQQLYNDGMSESIL